MTFDLDIWLAGHLGYIWRSRSWVIVHRQKNVPKVVDAIGVIDWVKVLHPTQHILEMPFPANLLASTENLE